MTNWEYDNEANRLRDAATFQRRGAIYHEWSMTSGNNLIKSYNQQQAAICYRIAREIMGIE